MPDDPDPVPLAMAARYRPRRGVAIVLVAVLGLALWGLASRGTPPLSSSVRPLPAIGQVELWADGDYEAGLHRLLSQARTSIDVTMYEAILPDGAPADHPIRRILELLVERQRAGVAVRVVLDHGIPRGVQRSADGVPSANAARYLAAAGVAVRWDEDGRTTHTKSLVVDGRWCVVGSTNWSKSALRFNREQSVLVASPELAAEMTRRFTDLWRRGGAVR